MRLDQHLRLDRHYVAFILAVAVTTGCARARGADGGGDVSQVAHKARPNIIWIVADDMSPDMGCYGDGQAWTPNLDALAAEGVRYTHAFAVNGQCAPSRAALITGMYPTTIGAHNMRSQALPPAYVRGLPVYLRRAGYFCTNNGKADYNLGNGTGVMSGVMRSPLGFWDEEGARAHWRNREEGQPFFAVFNLAQTHESRLHYSDKQFAKVIAGVAEERLHRAEDVELPAYYPDSDVLRSDWAKYYDLVTAMDAEAGELLRQLEEDGLRENTVVIFFGDHGRPLPRSKRWLYDSGLRVPLIIRWPGGEGVDGEVGVGRVDDHMVSFVDFAPTVLMMAGVAVPEHMQGHVFMGEGRLASPEYVFGQRDRVDELTDTVRSVRGRRFHYLKNYFPEIPYSRELEYQEKMPGMREWRRLAEAGELTGAAGIFFEARKPEEELYDTEADPDEVVNLAGDAEQAERIEEFRGVLEDWTEGTGDLGFTDEAELLERWRGDGEWATTEAPAIDWDGGGATLTCATEGAVIVYTLEEGRAAKWRLYSGSIEVEPGVTVRAKAGRLGFRDSPEVKQHLTGGL